MIKLGLVAAMLFSSTALAAGPTPLTTAPPARFAPVRSAAAAVAPATSASARAKPIAARAKQIAPRIAPVAPEGKPDAAALTREENRAMWLEALEEEQRCERQLELQNPRRWPGTQRWRPGLRPVRRSCVRSQASATSR